MSPKFFGGYFHEDWQDESGDEDGVVRLYLEYTDATPRDVARLLEEMDQLLALGLSDKDLSEALVILGSNYWDRESSTSAWLRSLREKLDAGRLSFGRALAWR